MVLVRFVVIHKACKLSFDVFATIKMISNSSALMAEVYSLCADLARILHCVTLDVDSTVVVPARYLSNKNEETDRLILYVKGRKRKWLSGFFYLNRIIIQSS